MPRLLPRLIAILCTNLLLAGCGSLLASMQSAPIHDEPTERTFAQQIEDESIETKAKVNIHAADEDLYDANIAVVSYNGYVLIAGQVGSEELKALATNVVRKIGTGSPMPCGSPGQRPGAFLILKRKAAT